MVTLLPLAEAAARAARCQLVVCDNDGVLTDGRVWVSERGEELKAFSLRDGMGVERLRAAGIETAIVTRESTAFAVRRAEKLRLRWCWTGVLDKRAHLRRVLEETRLSIAQLAYIGDDVNDLGIIEAIGDSGLTAAPADAMPEVAAAVHVHCRARGGEGAFREPADWILAQRAHQPTGGDR